MGGTAPDIPLSEVISALSLALDLTEGQPMGHAVRSCAIGMRLGETLGLDPAQRSDLFYALLLKDAGCSGNSAQLASLFGADDRTAKFERKLTDHHRPLESARYVLRHTAPGASRLARVRKLAEVVRSGSDGARRMTRIRCDQGAEIARMIGLSEATAQAIAALDEHWDGRGYPAALAGDAIPLFGRVLCIAQTVEVFHAANGLAAAFDVARERRGTWFDPLLVDALLATQADHGFWAALAGEDATPILGGVEPPDRRLRAGPDRLDRVAEAFAKVVDAKSPWTGRHSEGVARISVGIAETLGFAPDAVRHLRRAALLHDIGKLGVSSVILDKPDRLTADEWAQMRRHPELSERILMRVSALRPLAKLASAHHERLDGRGYFRGLTGDQLDRPQRILAVADVCDALLAERPYRPALEPAAMLEIIRGDAGTSLCPEACAALEHWMAGPAPSVAPVAGPAAGIELIPPPVRALAA